MSFNDVDEINQATWRAVNGMGQTYACSKCPNCTCAERTAQVRQEAVRRAQAQAAEWWSGGGLKCVKCGSRHASREVGGSWVCCACDSRKDNAPQVATASGAYAGQMGVQAPPPRTFTREEVLLMLRALRAAMHDHHAPTLNSIERMFERME